MTNQSDGSKPPSKEELFGKAKFNIEHALGMYAFSFCSIPAEGIYDSQILAPMMRVIETCHIYLIGYTPIIEFINAQQKERCLNLKFTVLGDEYTVSYELPEHLSLMREGELNYLEDASGQRYWPNEQHMLQKLCTVSEAGIFDVKYVGQAYGQDGSRNAIDRLLKHETLQKIALKGVPAGHRLGLLLLAVQPTNQLITVMNPFAKNKDEGGVRIRSGLEKLFNTTVTSPARSPV